MYIPTQLYGKVNSCVSASGGDSSGEFISGSQVWKYHKYTTLGSGSFTIHSGSTNNARVFVVAGGGGGGQTNSNGDGGVSEVAGGGGGGGVVYTDYRLGEGTYTLYVGDGGIQRENGEDSWIKMDYLPSDYDYYAPTGSQLTAEGGGNGAWLDSPNSPTSAKNASGGGSGGGGCQSLRYVGGYLKANRGGGRVPQGNNGGDADGPFCSGNQEKTATGGGGAGAAADDTNCISAVGYQTPGGDGKFYNVDGTNKEYSCGGASMRVGTWEAATNDTQPQGSRMYGAGGWGNSAQYGQSTKRVGKQGIIVVLYPICNIDLQTCTEYSVNGGSNGGNITFIPCGQTELETITLDPLDAISVCSYPITLPESYPSSSGDVTFTSTGSCSSYEVPPNPDSCPTGSVLSELYLTEMDVNAPNVGPYPGLVSFLYTDYLGQEQSTGELRTGTHYVCAISGSVRAGSITSGATYTITHTATQCGYFCSGSF